jgi:N-acetylglucosaminyldiphosphoundecaprenol N-acetyl-beta-D-mannosaminyltransferase
MSGFPSSDVLGLPLHMTTLPDAVRWAEAQIRENRRGYVCHVDVHSLMTARRRTDVHAALAGASLAATDGMPLVWIGRRRGFSVGRVYGPDFMEALVASTARWQDRPCRHFLYGGSQASLDGLARRVFAHRGSVLAGSLAPPRMTELADADLVRDCAAINAAAADVVWVGLGAPKQDLWMARCRAELTAPLLVGVGAAFDFLSGGKRQAPPWLRQAGLEWAFRLASEPRRLGRRYLDVIPRFCAALVWEAVSRSRSR